ncbi:MAG: hypothetical protein GXY32_07660 [Ruminococcaceae bacterium]|nr:hypothetical protein [Oscillospiraceae bacterium]
MKRMMAGLVAAVMVVLLLGGCSSKSVDKPLVLKNATEYELQSFAFQLMEGPHMNNPMRYALSEDRDEPLQPGEERETTINLPEKNLTSTWAVRTWVVGADTYIDIGSFISLEGVAGFEISGEDADALILTAIPE